MKSVSPFGFAGLSQRPDSENTDSKLKLSDFDWDE